MTNPAFQTATLPVFFVVVDVTGVSPFDTSMNHRTVLDETRSTVKAEAVTHLRRLIEHDLTRHYALCRQFMGAYSYETPDL